MPNLQSTSPANRVALIEPNNSTVLSPTRAISFAGQGTLAIVDADGNTVTIPSGALAAGIMHPISATQVLLTGTSATDIVGYW